MRRILQQLEQNSQFPLSSKILNQNFFKLITKDVKTSLDTCPTWNAITIQSVVKTIFWLGFIRKSKSCKGIQEKKNISEECYRKKFIPQSLKMIQKTW